MTTSDLLRETRVDGRPKRRKQGEKEQPKVRLVPDDSEDESQVSDEGELVDESEFVGETGLAEDVTSIIEQPVGERAAHAVASVEGHAAVSERSARYAESDSEFPRLDDRYEVLSIIGKGGMGAVYKVLDKELGKTLAIKVLQSDLAGDQTALRRFEQEAEAASQLTHNNLVSVFGYGKTKDGAPYLVMDYFDGCSLAAVLKEEKTLESGRALNVFHQICEALVHAHEQGVIHRDIKPANVIVSTTDAGIETARIVDFGIAKILPVANRETHNLTETRQVFGSPHYMSPEHCLGFKMDERSDIYSLGCLMYEVLTGDPPFSVSDAIQIVIKHINEEPLAFSEDMSNDPIKRKLEGVVLKCLEKEQENRYQSVKEVIADLELIDAGKTPARYVRRRAAKLEYTTGQIIRAIVGTFLS
jgi:Serine/threonine protein kinase